MEACINLFSENLVLEPVGAVRAGGWDSGSEECLQVTWIPHVHGNYIAHLASSAAIAATL